MKQSKPKVLCVCSAGMNRSKYLANYLKRKGYLTRYRGAEPEIYPKGIKHPLKQEDIDWSDIIIAVRPRLKDLVKAKFNTREKKIILMDVTDSKEVVARKFPEFKKEYPDFEKMEDKVFQKKWTYTQLRKAIKPHLPNLNKTKKKSKK
jgi:predicted protein tyrosine phosphatase